MCLDNQTTLMTKAYARYRELIDQPWNGDVIDRQYILDLINSVSEIGRTYYEIFKQRKEFKYMKGYELVAFLFDNYMNKNGQLSEEFFSSLHKNTFMLNTLALKMLKIYTFETEVYLVVNKVQRDE